MTSRKPVQPPPAPVRTMAKSEISVRVSGSSSRELACCSYRSVQTTMRYTRVTGQHIAGVQSPIDVLGTPMQRKIG